MFNKLTNFTGYVHAIQARQNKPVIGGAFYSNLAVLLYQLYSSKRLLEQHVMRTERQQSLQSREQAKLHQCYLPVHLGLLPSTCSLTTVTATGSIRWLLRALKRCILLGILERTDPVESREFRPDSPSGWRAQPCTCTCEGYIKVRYEASKQCQHPGLMSNQSTPALLLRRLEHLDKQILYLDTAA